MFENKRILKLLLSICFISLSVALVIAYLSPASGYEVSLYSSTPILYWFLLVFCFSLCIFLIFHYMYTERFEHSYFWIICFTLLVLCRFSLLCLPYIRDYLYPWRGDSMTHIGYAIDILLDGHYLSSNFYPVSHTLIASVVIISGLPLEFVSKYSTPFLSVLFLLFIYFFAKTVLLTKESVIFSLIIASSMFSIFDYAISPNGWSILYLPLVLALFFRQSLDYKILLSISIILLPFFHVFTSSMLVFILIVVSLIYWFFNNNRLNSYFSAMNPSQFLNSIILELTILLMWILSFKYFNKNIKALYDSFTSTSSNAFATEVITKLDKVDVHGFEVILLAIKMYGNTFIFIGLSAVAFYLFIKKFSWKYGNFNIFIIFSLFFCFFSAYVIYLFNLIPGFKNFAGHRMLMFLGVFAPLCTSFFLQYFKDNRNYILYLVGIFLIITASLISILNLFTSPWIIQPNSQVTCMEVDGMNWFFNYRNQMTDIVIIMTPPHRYADEIMGSRERNERDISGYYENIPDHFNYSVYKTIGESYAGKRYAVISEYDKTIYNTVWINVGRFYTSDFIILESDKTASKLYNNNEFDVWMFNYE